MVASPRYLAGPPPIKEPGDLAKHQIVAFSHLGLDHWNFTPAKGSSIPWTVKFTPRFIVNTVSAAAASAVAGTGLTRLYSHQVAVVGDPRVVAENTGFGAPSTKMAMFSMKSYRLTGTQGLLPGGC